MAFSCFPFRRVRVRLVPVGLIRRRTSSRQLVPILTAVLACWVSAPAGRLTSPRRTVSRAAPISTPTSSARRARGAPRGVAPHTRRCDRCGSSGTAPTRTRWRRSCARPARARGSSPRSAFMPSCWSLTPGCGGGIGRDAQRRVAALGYVDRWLVLGPFDNTGKTGFDSRPGAGGGAPRPGDVGALLRG